MNTRALILAIGLVGTVVLANWLVSAFGLIPAGFGLLVPAGTYAAGLALCLRDLLHDSGGVRGVLGAIAVGIVVSFLLGDGRIALASAVAFGLAELLDLAVYAPLRRRAWKTAVIASNAVGAVVDTLVFLPLAGFLLTFATVGGQLLVKAVWVTATFLLLTEGVRRFRPRPGIAHA
jgi:uncharacterized PurR-regulated membrane protein YhhQ (DUF165 family)